MNFPVVELILIPLGLKYSPQDHVLNTLSLHTSLDVRDHVSQPFSTSGNIIILYFEPNLLRHFCRVKYPEIELAISWLVIFSPFPIPESIKKSLKIKPLN